MVNQPTLPPTIAVVIPLFNKALHIADTLASVFNQTLQPTEIIVVDDGSTDDGADIVRQYQRVTLVQQQNAGVSAARNTGVAAASSDLIAFIDADDRWLPQFLQEIVILTKGFPQAGVFTTGYQFCINKQEYRLPKIRFGGRGGQQSRLLDDYFDIGARGDLPFTMSSIAVRADVMAQLGGFPLNEPMGEDQELFCRAALFSSIAYNPKVLANYHLDASNRACLQHIPAKECPFSVRLHQLTQTLESESLCSSIDNYRAAHILHLASLHVRNKQVTIAKDLLQQKVVDRLWLRKWWWWLRCQLVAVQH
ncbi:glycosyltransferase family 2 protein [Ferrimonas lipolytica]|uniref:Glycosyltransferase family 2 protein n=1 Tax=Ferrimonas lipolytica TaxID=2724191 RepID=A0A6H1UBE6_9GAMM|nr:glycosyltransferase family A protein [Ferrimonas lipolytica]QIZ76364.1 glycosyltransferase family 2 protein [Ferrimonas lipolytica]